MTADMLPTGRRGQLLAIALGLLAVALLWFAIIDPVRSWYDDRAMLLERRETLLDRMRQVAATLPALRAAAAEKQSAGEETAVTMLPGGTDAVAAADLQERVQAMASNAGVNLTAVETLPAATAGQWHRISLRISMNAPWPVLMQLVRSIEKSPTRILIDDVHFHSATLVTRPTVLPVQASLVVYGFRPARPGAES